MEPVPWAIEDNKGLSIYFSLLGEKVRKTIHQAIKKLNIFGKND